MAYPASNPTLSTGATSLLVNNAAVAGLPNASLFDRLTLAELVLGNLLTDAPATMNLTTSGLIRSSNSSTAIGYTTGAGSSTTQLTGKTTAFTCNTVTGQITLNNSAVAGWGTSSSIFNCSAMTPLSVVIFNHVSGGTVGVYTFNASSHTTSSCNFSITNNSTASVSDAVVFRYAIINGAVS
jgi:hypothetical protein